MLPCQTPAGVVVVPRAFDAVYRRYFRSVWRLLERLGVARAQLDDAAQDVFLVVHRRSGEFGVDGPPQSWIFAVAVRVASEYRRRAQRRPIERLPDDITDRAPRPDQQSELKESLRLLSELLDKLDEKRREVFVLAELEQLTVPEIANVLGVNPNTVYTRLRAARKRFEAALERARAKGRGR